MAPGRHVWKDRRFFITSSAVVLLALLLRLYRLGAQELWLDEGYSYLLATQREWFGPPTLANNSPPLYHFLLRILMPFAGEDEVALRLLSAVFGTMLVAALIWTGSEIFTPAVGLWSGAFAAIAPFHIFYSQEARAYALLLFALTLTYGLVARALRDDTLRAWLSVALAAALALYSHLFAILGLVPTILMPWALSHRRDGGHPWRRYSLAMGTALALIAPWIVVSFTLAPHAADDPEWPWLKIGWDALPPALAIPKSLEILGLGGQAGLAPTLVKQFRTLEFPHWARMIGVFSLSGLFLWASVPWGDRLLGIAGLGRRKVWLWTLLFFPLVTLWLYSYFVTPVYVVSRYDAVSFPAYAMLIGLALWKLSRFRPGGRLLATVVATIFSLPLFLKLSHYYQAPSPMLFQRQASTLARVTTNDDAVVFSGLQGHVVLYYLGQSGYRCESGVCRHEVENRRFFCRFYLSGHDRSYNTFPNGTLSRLSVRDEVARSLMPLLPPGGTVWVLPTAAKRTTEGLLLMEWDAAFVSTLQNRGFRMVEAEDRERIYGFRRSSQP